jgi:hypothetical protein
MDQPHLPAQSLPANLISPFTRSRRLEDRIRKLCSQAVATADLTDLPGVLDQLKAALHDHVERLRKLAAGRSIPPERRHS